MSAFDLATAVTEREGWAMGQPCDGRAVVSLYFSYHSQDLIE